jgi:dolichol-phosphate mannosyltransferase
MNKLFVVLPCYNEAENIAELVENWKHQEKKLNGENIHYLEIVVVDDGSIDDTRSILKSKIEDSSNIKILRHAVNKGLGEAIKTGIEHVLKHSGREDYLCIMDSDNTHDPAFVHNMLEKICSSKSDCVIASRYQDGAKTVGVSALRQGMSLGARLFYSLSMRIPRVRDYTCGYRLYRIGMMRKVYEAYDSDFISEKGFTCMVEILYKLYLVGAAFEEIPFELRYDYKKGASKMKVMRNAFKSLHLTVKLKKSAIGA